VTNRGDGYKINAVFDNSRGEYSNIHTYIHTYTHTYIYIHTHTYACIFHLYYLTTR